MHVFSTDNLGRDYVELLQVVRTEGAEVRPRGMLVREFSPLALELQNPYRCVVDRKGFSRALMYLEIASLLSGVFDKEAYEAVSPNAADMLTAQGAYGPRVRVQVGYVIDELLRDPDSRRAVVYVGRETDLQYSAAFEQPCTMTWQFLLRDDRLNMVVNMRSWDLVWGLGYDLPCFVAVQDAVAMALGFPVGTYSHFAGSGHVYERHFDLAPVMIDAELPSFANTSHVTEPRRRMLATTRDAADAIDAFYHARGGPDISVLAPQWREALSLWRRAFEARMRSG